jgi:AI-2 transport protein TqsA
MVQEHREQSWLITVSLVILAVVALAIVLIYTRAIMIPFVVSLFIVALVSPVEDFQIKKLHLPRSMAVIVTLLVVLAVIAVVFVFVYQAIYTIVSTAGDYSASFAYMANRVLEPVEYFYREDELGEPAAPNDAEAAPAPNEPAALGEQVGDEVGVPPDFDLVADEAEFLADPNDDEQMEATAELPPDLAPQPPPRKMPRIDTKQIVRDLKNYIFNIVTNTFGTIFGLITGVFFVSIFVIFLLAGRNPYAEHSEMYTDIVQKIRRYVGTKVVISGVTGILVWAILSAIQLPLAAVFGILAFLLNFIPSIGSIIATLLPIPIAVAEFHATPWMIVVAVLLPGVVQNILGNIVEPKLMGEGLNLHPVTVLLALSFWGLLWGIVGMFLAAPITAAIRIILMQFDTLRPIANALAGDFGNAPAKVAQIVKPPSSPGKVRRPGGASRR